MSRKYATTKEKIDSMADDPNVMRRNVILLAIAKRAIELGSQVETGKEDVYINGILGGLNEAADIIIKYGA